MPSWALYAVCVAIWGSTWIAITYQLGTVAPEVSVAYRFLLATACVFIVCRLRREPVRFDVRQHLTLALQGAFMYSIGYVFVYHAETRIVSGLAAVAFSASPLVTMVCTRVMYGTPLSARVGAGGLLGLGGVALIFLPVIRDTEASDATLEGAACMAVALVISSIAAALVSRNPQRGLRVWPAMGWGMAYGGLCSLTLAVLRGHAIGIDTSPSYLLSLAYLSLLGAVVGFACFITLIERIGAGRAGYVGVMVPVVALCLSAAFEGFHWTAATGFGVALSIAGNVVVMRRSATPALVDTRAAGT